MIEDFRFGSMTVNGRKYTSDLKIVGGKVVESWWRKEGHSVHLEDVNDILAYSPDFLVVGMGEPGRMQVTGTLKSVLAEADINLIEEPTPQAVQSFNGLCRKGKKVAGAFHLTC